MKPHPTKSKPRIAKPSPRQPGTGGRVRHLLNDNLTLLHAPDKDATPVLVLDLSDEARERRRENVAKALRRSQRGWLLPECRHIARAVLLAIGDTPAEGRGK